MNPLETFEALNFNSKPQNLISHQATQALEAGKILYFPHMPFALQDGEENFLNPALIKQSKNISYTPKTNALKGTCLVGDEHLKLSLMINRFYQQSYAFMQSLLVSYQHNLTPGRTSFRPVEIANRPVKSYTKDDTRLHVDAFPSTPMANLRIIRFFSNINLDGLDRVWRTGEHFNEVAARFFPLTKPQWPGRAWLLHSLGLTKSRCTEYDYRMLQIHDNMKADLSYQSSAPQQTIAFPPGSSWIVQTDHVSHAAMSGQHVLEQTFYLPYTSMIDPSLSPQRILEQLAQQPLQPTKQK